SPHIGGGIGPVHLDATLSSGSLGKVMTGGDWVFGYQAIGGISFPISPTLAVDVDYPYLGTSTPPSKTAATLSMETSRPPASGSPRATIRIAWWPASWCALARRRRRLPNHRCRRHLPGRYAPAFFWCSLIGTRTRSHLRACRLSGRPPRRSARA